jgi:DNA-binding NarL/FixJ family response regulator
MASRSRTLTDHVVAVDDGLERLTRTLSDTGTHDAVLEPLQAALRAVRRASAALQVTEQEDCDLGQNIDQGSAGTPGSWRSRRLSADSDAGVDTLTVRELQILRLLAEGLDSHAIARCLFISERTERNHVANILAKLRVHSRLQALVVCVRLGVIDLA